MSPQLWCRLNLQKTSLDVNEKQNSPGCMRILLFDRISCKHWAVESFLYEIFNPHLFPSVLSRMRPSVSSVFKRFPKVHNLPTGNWKKQTFLLIFVVWLCNEVSGNFQKKSLFKTYKTVWYCTLSWVSMTTQVSCPKTLRHLPNSVVFIHGTKIVHFLVTHTWLFMRVCPSIGPSVPWSVRRSVGPCWVFF